MLRACGGSGGEIRPEQGCSGKESRGKGREHFHTCPRCKGTGIEPDA